jgi:hypothetical protein
MATSITLVAAAITASAAVSQRSPGASAAANSAVG